MKNCALSPHVTVVPPLGTIDVNNPTGLVHQIQLLSMEEGANEFLHQQVGADNGEFRIPAKHLKFSDYLELTSIMHFWMRAYVVVHDPRLAAISDANGRFTIANIPPGKYKVLFNHDSGAQEREFEIQAGEVTDAGEILFKVK